MTNTGTVTAISRTPLKAQIQPTSLPGGGRRQVAGERITRGMRIERVVRGRGERRNEKGAREEKG